MTLEVHVVAMDRATFFRPIESGVKHHQPTNRFMYALYTQNVPVHTNFNEMYT
jgi:hypothetical protein